jgi:hypothetical protein
MQSEVEWYWPQKSKVISIDDYILNGDFTNCPCDILLLREALNREPFAFGNGSIYKIDYDTVQRAIEQGYSVVWSNSDIACLIKK